MCFAKYPRFAYFALWLLIIGLGIGLVQSLSGQDALAANAPDKQYTECFSQNLDSSCRALAERYKKAGNPDFAARALARVKRVPATATAVVKPSVAGAANTVKPTAPTKFNVDRLLSYYEVSPDFKLDLFVPAGWESGMLTTGQKVLSKEPRIVVFGGISLNSDKQVGELFFMTREPGYDPAIVFREIVRQTLKGTPTSLNKLPNIDNQWLAVYSIPDGKEVYQRIAFGKKAAVAISFVVTPHSEGLDTVKQILVKSKFSDMK